jgi:alanine-glyoxylate transaminase/serine-glyoxylate transaminase/serine-pyruvate transaminase
MRMPLLTATQLDPKRTDIDHAIKSLEEALAECGYKKA